MQEDAAWKIDSSFFISPDKIMSIIVDSIDFLD